MKTVPVEVQEAFNAKFAYLKCMLPEAEVNGVIHQDERGVWRCTYKSSWSDGWAQVCMHADGRCFETHGGICRKWYEVSSWIGLPVSDEESDGPDHQISHFENGDIRWARITDTFEVIPKDKRSWYNYRHAELLGYLKSALEISQPQRHEEALKAVQKKCIEDQFDVVLLGEFQSGKSTTLDVLCRGRELSPQGDGLKSTSAVPVSIEAARPEQAPEGMAEWAELCFKSEQQIKDEIFETYEVYLQSAETNVADGLKPFVRGEGSGTSKEIFREKFDLKNPKHLELVRRIAASEWGSYEKNHGCLSTYHRQQLEVLTIYLKFYGTPEYRSVSERRIVSVPDVAKYVYFPRNWEGRSPASLDFDLTFDECVFAFLEFAILHINSKVLSQLNCRITDCPGLGASAYDTAVAGRALSRADGVWFVKKCDKQLSASTLGAIFDLIKNNGRLARTGMALNLWKSHKKSLVDDPKSGTCLVKYCEEQLIKEGYTFPVFWCNARFAYLSALGQRKIEDGTPFAANERTWMIEKVIEDEDRCDPSWSDEELWVEAVRAANVASKVSELESIEAFGQEAVDLLWKHSNMDNALEVMAKIVLEQKGRAILIDNGSQKAFEILKRYEQELQLVEDNATREAQEVQNELDRARKRMEKYIQETKSKTDGSLLWTRKRNLASRMADDFVRYVLNREFCDNFARSSAKVIYNLNKGFGGVFSSDFKNKFLTEINPLLETCIRERFNAFTANEWKPDSVSENVSEFFERVENLNGEMRRLVEELEADGTIFGRLPIPKISADGLNASAASGLVCGMLSVVDRYRTGFLEDIWDLLKLIAGGWVKDLIFGKMPDSEIIDDMAKRLTRDVERILDSRSLRDELKSGVQPSFEEAADAALKQLHAGISTCMQSFEARCRELDAANAASDERKREIAAANRKIRTEKVQPLREKLEAFEKSVAEELK